MYFLAIETTSRRLASISSRLACSASMSPWIISRCVRFSSTIETPASPSIFSRSALQFFCWRRYSFLSSSLFDASCFWSSERICRSSVRMVSTVLLTLSSSRLRSSPVYFSSRTMRET